MEKKVINCEVITPMFSYGGDSKKPELRPTELKGLMRYVYRITQQIDDSKELFKQESDLFGSTKKPSPIRLQMIENDIIRLCKSLTLHKSATYADIKKSIEIKSTFDITLRYRNDIDEQFYDNILRLSFYLSGMGKRTRRARGCVRIIEDLKTPKDTKIDILNLLNKVSTDGVYEYNNCIKPKRLSESMRPVIQQISFGETFQNDKLNIFLKAVDTAGHETKNGKSKKKEARLDPTGYSERASSIIVSVAKTTNGYLPIFTYVKAINWKAELDSDLSKREKFQEMIK